MARFSRTRKTPYGKTVKAKKFVPKPLPPSPYLWVLVHTDDYKKAFQKNGALAVRELVLKSMQAKDFILGKYFKEALDDDVPPDTVIVRGDTRFKSLEVIGRTTEDGEYRPRLTALDISKRIE